MSVYFNGKRYVSPVTVSAVDDTALANRNPNVGNVLAIIGASEGGLPLTPILFSDPINARKVLVSGNLAEAVAKAFDPSNETPAPARVIAVRTNPATQASLTLQGAGAVNVINLKSSDYGLRANQTRVEIAAGTTTGLRLTTQFGQEIYTRDNVARRAFEIEYTGGEASAVMSITNDTVTLEAPTATTVATADLNTYSTIRELVDYLATIPGFTVTVLDNNDDQPALNGLDTITDEDVRTDAYVARADLQAAVDYFNGFAEGLVDAERLTGAGLPPAPLASTYLSGGTNGTVTTDEWAACLEALQAENVRWIVPLTGDSAVHAMVETHCQFMSEQGRNERRMICGGNLADTQAAALANAAALGSDRAGYVYPGHFDYDASGTLKLYPAYMTAAIVGAMFAGVSPGEPLTNHAMKVQGLETLLRNPTDTDVLLEGGVMPIERTETGFRVVQSISTWQINDNYNRVELSTGAALDAVSLEVRRALDVLRGQRGTPRALSRAVDITDSVLRELSVEPPNGPGLLVGDEDSPPFRSIQAEIDGDVLRVSFQASPVIPLNYGLITIYAVPFSAVATA